MAQDPEFDDSNDTGHEADMVPLFSSSNIDAELEANNIHSILQSMGIPSVLIGASVIPSLEFQVQVPRSHFDEAQRAIAEAQAAGPEAAAEAEANSEESRS